jgi:single-stranded DNA-binding protein
MRRSSVRDSTGERGVHGEWVEVEPTRHVVQAFKTLAENIAASLAKGDRVFVHGTVTTEAWADKQTGQKRTAQRVLAEAVGPSLRWATARITEARRSSVIDEAPHDVGEHKPRSRRGRASGEVYCGRPPCLQVSWWA